jgi:hypothetical protein
MSEVTQADKDAANKLCGKYLPSVQGMGKAIAEALAKAREEGAKRFDTDTPMAWMVWSTPRDECDYRVYLTKHDAESEAECQNADLDVEEPPQYKAIPLYIRTEDQ